MPAPSSLLAPSLLLAPGGVVETSPPSLLVEIDITNKPTNPTRVWTDITAYARSVSWTRSGRSAETERSQGGQISSLLLANYDDELNLTRLFDKDNTDSPYYPGLRRSFFVRISFVFGGVAYPMFTGIKSAIPKARPSFGADQVATIVADDTLKVLELFLLTGRSYAIGSAGDRVTAVLSDAGCAIGTIGPGKANLVFPPIDFSDTDETSALSHLQQVEQDERGFLIAQADGSIDFQDRFYRAVHDIPSVTIGEDDGDIRYVESDFDDDNGYLWNTVAVTPSGGTVEISSDAASIEDNFERRLPIAMLSTSQSQALSNAQWYRNRYADPPQRVGQIEVLGERDATTWPAILAAKNSDIFTWRGGGNEQQVRLERVSGSWTPGSAPRILWDLSPAVRDYIWQLGVPGRSELGVTTRLG